MTTYQEKIIKPRIGLLQLAEQLGNVSQACKVMGYSRDTFYRYKELHEQGGAESLFEMTRKKPCLKNRVPSNIEDAVVNIAVEFPAYGQERTANELRRRGIIISGGGVRSVWLRHDLENFKKRLKALDAKVANDGIILSDAQLAALEKIKNKREATGEIETMHPGYLGSQDTYYVGNIKGIGRIYQQTFVDTYSRVAICKLYTEKTAITTADHLNDRVIPFFEKYNIPLLRILTDRGTEYCGKPENHAYQLYLGIENIDHSRTKAYSPQTNGICERFHKTMQEECYHILFRKKLYNTLDELQADIDTWLTNYNNERSHSGKHCFGKTPMQTFRDSLYIAKDKNISNIERISDNLAITYQAA
ncbi:IS481 family transposase [Candidatus Tisiphia endosymbiont of Thecophora atra]|uniref:IS481 family transposase n=1 Tax=Candidatus Tisiphia endosymbiont of Thecophora atra TaxID=3066258 RepID=UPI00312CBD9C